MSGHNGAFDGNESEFILKSAVVSILIISGSLKDESVCDSLEWILVTSVLHAKNRRERSDVIVSRSKYSKCSKTYTRLTIH